MSTTALNGLRDYLADTLSPNNMLWLAAQLTEQAAKKNESQQKPYTIEELHARIAISEQQSAEGLFQDFDKAMDEIEQEFAEEDKKTAMAEAI